MEVARNQLRSLGYTAEFVRNGQEAVDAAKRDRYDIILMDCQMPEKDGFEATADIRLFEGDDRHTTIVAVTAHALEGDRKKCLAAGMDDYLSKPVKIDALRSILTAWTPLSADDAEWPEELSTGVADNVIDRTVLANYEELQRPGEPDIVIKLIDLFMDRSSESITCLQRAALAGDLPEVIRQAHGIKGSSGNIGAGVMAGLSARLEKVDSPLAAVELAATLEKAFEDVSGILVSIRDVRQDGEI
jgi:CheY-like chemotaxis protein